MVANVDTSRILGQLEGRMDGMDKRLGNVEQRLGNVEQRLGNVEQRLDKLFFAILGLGTTMMAGITGILIKLFV